MPPALSPAPDGNFADSLNARSSGSWSHAMGIHFLHATADEVTAELTIGPAHRQPYGIVHGGMHSGLIETVASAGAALAALPRGQSVVGLENHTSFLIAVREGNGCPWRGSSCHCCGRSVNRQSCRQAREREPGGSWSEHCIWFRGSGHRVIGPSGDRRNRAESP